VRIHYGNSLFEGGCSLPKFVIEREIPGAGSMSTAQLQGVAVKSCSVLRALGPQIQWVQSYVTDNKIYCIYIAPNEEMVREHAQLGGFPANSVAQVRRIIDPTTAEDLQG
jgi:uracil phosphoribosyltransferase